MIDNNDGHNNIEESVIAKSTGKQEEEDIAVKDARIIQCPKLKEKDDKARGRLQGTRWKESQQQ